jgi:cytochrome oxidase Cu insertion factor (SCO1/SenC/PrrC family)
MSNPKSTRERILRTLGLLALLVIFPLTSWYFLQTGLNFTKDKFDKMQELAQVDSFILYPEFGDSITNNTLKGRMSVIADPGTTLQYLDSLSLIHEDLADERWVWIIIRNGSEIIDQNLDSNYPFLLDSSTVKLVRSFRFSRKNGIFDKDVTINPNEIGLVDTKGRLRYIYDLDQADELELFISHLVLLVPKE